MLKKLAQAAKAMVDGAPTVDASQFGDPVAERTEWHSLHSGAKSFRTHSLRIRGERAVFGLSLGGWLYYGLGLPVGLTVLLAGPQVAYQHYGFDPKVFLTAALGLLITIAGAWVLARGTAPVVFDRRRGAYWRGRIEPERVADPSTLSAYLALSDLHALQLLKEKVSDERSSYFSYELNLVRHDGSRLPVIQHGHRDAIHADAVALAEFLAVPLWAPNSSVLDS